MFHARMRVFQHIFRKTVFTLVDYISIIPYQYFVPFPYPIPYVMTPSNQYIESLRTKNNVVQVMLFSRVFFFMLGSNSLVHTSSHICSLQIRSVQMTVASIDFTQEYVQSTTLAPLYVQYSRKYFLPINCACQKRDFPSRLRRRKNVPTFQFCLWVEILDSRSTHRTLTFSLSVCHASLIFNCRWHKRRGGRGMKVFRWVSAQHISHMWRDVYVYFYAPYV